MQCKVCSNETDNREYEVREMMYACGDTFQYFQCSRCGCLQIAEIPSDMSKYYGDGYYSYQSVEGSSGFRKLLMNLRNGYCVFGHGVLGRLLFRLFPTMDFQFLAHTEIGKDSRILDVGCGAGRLLFSLRELGFRNLLGVDPFLPQDIDYDNGLTIRKQFLAETSGVWDLIMCHHSFEHIPDGYGVLKDVARLLDPRGICVIRVPTASSHAWEHYGVNWVQLDAPRHIWLHSVESMRIVAGQAGFEVVRTVYDSGSMQFWGSEQYLKGVALCGEHSYAVNRRKSGFSAREIRKFERKARELNAAQRGDQAAFYLRRI